MIGHWRQSGTVVCAWTLACFGLVAATPRPASADARVYLPLATRATAPDVSAAETWTLPAGTVRATTWSGDHLLASVADRLFVLDLGESGRPTAVGHLDVPAAHRIRARGDIAYVAAWGELIVVDVADQAPPRPVGRLTGEPDSGAWDIDLASTFAVVAAGRETLTVDIGDPERPTALGRVATPPVAGSVSVAGDIAVVSSAADFEGTVHVLDISDAARPTIAATLEVPGARDVVARGDYAYIAAAGLVVLDISAPSAPRVASSDAPQGCAEPMALALVGDSLVASCFDTGALQLFSLTEPARPVAYADGSGGRLDLPQSHEAVPLSVSGDRVAASLSGFGVLVVDASTPASPRELTRYEVVGRVEKAAGGGPVAFVADWYGGLRALDLSDPGTAAVAASAYESGAYCRSVAVARDHAYLPCGSGTDEGLRVFDVSVPLAPRPATRLETVAGRLAADGDLLVLAGYRNELTVVDIAEPDVPTVVGSLAMAGNVADLVLAEGHAYVAEGPLSLRVVDVGEPTLPRVVATAAMPDSPVRVAVEGSVAYVLTHAASLVVLDVTDPDHPRQLARATGLGGYGEGLAVARGIAYALVWHDAAGGSYAGKLVVIDVSAPERPRTLGSLAAPTGRDVSIVGDLVLVGSERELKLVRTIR